jgi:GT2 family glycosyltransferase
MDHISLIIVNYNTEAETHQCLTSLAKLEAANFNYTIVIVDNGSREQFALTKTEQKLPVEIVRSESNLGFTGGNNLGIKFALDKYNSDFVLLLNNDTYVDPTFLKQLYRYGQKHPEQGMICPKIYFAQGFEYHQGSYQVADRGRVLWYGGGSIDWPNLLCFHRAVDEVDLGQVDNFTTSDFATGCCILIKREVLEKVGLFDERYFLYLEDVDLSLRAVEKGYQIGFCPEAVIWHKNAGSSGGSGSALHQYYQTRNRLLFGLMHGSNRNRITTISYLLRLLTSAQPAERYAATDLILGRLGKRVVI